MEEWLVGKVANTQSVTVIWLPRGLFADLHHFAALENVRLQVIGRDLMAMAVAMPSMMPDMIQRGRAMERGSDDARLQIPAVHRNLVQEFSRLSGSQTQPALRGLFDWMAENGEVVLGLVKRE